MSSSSIASFPAAAAQPPAPRCCYGESTALTDLTEAYGFERASRAYLASLSAVSGLRSLVLELGLSCDMREKHSLYLAAGSTGKELLGEHQLRKRAGLPGEFLDHARLLDVFGIGRAGAIVSPGLRMPTRCNWRADCLELRLPAARAYSRRKPLNLMPRRARSASS